MNYPMLDYDLQKLEYHLESFNKGADLFCYEEDKQLAKQLSNNILQAIEKARDFVLKGAAVNN